MKVHVIKAKFGSVDFDFMYIDYVQGLGKILGLFKDF